jgi:hypothetical protein
VALVRDLTDAMYNPARPPYVSHADGTRLVIEYIEIVWIKSLTDPTAWRNLFLTGRKGPRPWP